MKSNVRLKAEVEFDILQQEIPDSVALHFKEEILSILDKLGSEELGLSGAAAPYYVGAIADAIKKLGSHKPLTPIRNKEDGFTGRRDPEFNSVQNMRDSALFREGDDTVTYIDAVKWYDVEGDYHFSGGKVGGISCSQQVHSFPFTPKSFSIGVKKVWNSDNTDFDYEIVDWDAVKEMEQYYA